MRDQIENADGQMLAEVMRLDRLLCLAVKTARHGDEGAGDSRFRGLYVSDGQIDEILHQVNAGSLLTNESGVAGRLADRLTALTDLFGLSAFETGTVLLCLLPELDVAYERLYAYLQNDITKKRPTVDTVIRLHTAKCENTTEFRQAFSASAPLFKNQLLQFAEERTYSTASLQSRQLEIDERISCYLLGNDYMDARLLPFVRMKPSVAKLCDAIIADETRRRLKTLISQFKDKAFVLHLSGHDRQSVAEAVCGEMGLPLLTVEMESLPTDNSSGSLLPLVFREARLQGAVVCIRNEVIRQSEERNHRPFRILSEEICGFPGWVIFSGEQEFQPGHFQSSTPLVSVDLPEPSYHVRLDAWRVHSRGFSFADDIDFPDLAARFRLSAGKISEAIGMARNLALWRSGGESTITLQDIREACRKMSRPGLKTLARKVASNYSWPDIVLPKEQIDHLREICSHVKFREAVYGQWGFGLKHSRGKGLNVLFAGFSGTGKTMAAEIIAGELGFDLYKIDLSTIVSKYIGETEKNLDRVFQEAQMSNAILFFDEADALFGKRSEVRDSHDRYANIEIAYLLQKMEDYDGVVILATNLRKNMDDAFARRMHFTIEFPMPDEEDRLRMWQKIFPAEAPLAEDLDLPFLARQFRVSGGNIRNIAIAAAFLAAEDGKKITTEHLIKATKREYQKIGKLSTESEFAQYYQVIKS